MGKILVCGSVNVDVIAQSSEPTSNVRKSGMVQLCYGGLGHNLSLNLHELGEDVGFLGAVNDSGIVRLAIESMSNRGIRCHVKTQESLDDSLFVANFQEGQLVNATSTQAMSEAFFERNELRPIFEKYDYIIASTIFSNETLTNMSSIARELEIPFFISVNSESLAKRITNLPYITAAFMNKREANSLQEALAVTSPEDAASMLNAQLVISQGKSSFLHAKADATSTNHPFQEYEVMGTTLGVGELSVANLLRSYMQTGAFDFSTARNGVERVLSVNHGHLGASHSLKLSLQREARKAEADTLTGTLNRRGMDKFIERRNKQTGKLSALLIDIDYFKRINDEYGHDVGDSVLQHVSSQLKRFVRASDGLCRWGGEEFLVMLPDISTTSASILAERIRKKIANTRLPQLNKNISVSIGVAERKNNETISELIKSADIALYKAKESGRDRVIVFDEDKHKTVCPTEEISCQESPMEAY